MADEVHGFDERGARRITDAVRWVERQNPATGGAGGAHRPTRDGWLIRPIRITDAAPTSDGLLTGYVQSIGATPKDATTWVDGEAVWVKWPGGSSQPPELGVNTFGELRIHLGVRLTEVTSAGTRRAMWMVVPSSLVVPVYLGNLTPTSGSYHDGAIDPEGSGGGSTSTCWAVCLNSGGNVLGSYGPYLGLVSGKVTVSGSERPRVLFSVPSITIYGEESDGDPVSALVQSLSFDVGDFDLTTGGSVVLSHLYDEIAISLEGVPIARAQAINLLQPVAAGGSSASGNVTWIPLDDGGGVVTLEAFVDPDSITGVVHDTGDESIAGTKTFTGGLVIPTGASHPGSPVNGQMWHKDGGSLYGYEDSETRRLFTVPDSSYSQGAVPYINGSTKPVMLAPGTATQALKTGGAGANPAWGWIDGDEVTYTPGTLADWDGSADPGDVADALDQLAERVADLEAGGAVDASTVTYTPVDTGNWDGSTDPGNVDDALDQLAERVTAQHNGGPLGYKFGLECSTDSGDPDHDMVISAGVATPVGSADNPAYLSSALIKRIDANWAAGTNQGGLDTGSVANNTWYYAWLIKDTVAGTVDVLFSTSATSPTLTGNYAAIRRLRGFRTNGSANIVETYQDPTDGGCYYASPPLDISDTSLAATRETYSLGYVPPDYSVFVTLSVIFTDAGNITAWFTSPDQDDDAPGTDRQQLHTAFCRATQIHLHTSATGTVCARASSAGGDLYARVMRWKEP